MDSGLSSAFGGTSTRTWITPPKAKPHHWYDGLTDNPLVGFLGNLSEDVIHTGVGIPAGVIHLIEHPIAGVETAAKATWHDWSPLFHGEFGKWAHQTYEHPLAPILDVASFFTGGASLSARGAGALAKIGERSALAAGETAAADAARVGRLARYADPYKARLEKLRQEHAARYPHSKPQTSIDRAAEQIQHDPLNADVIKKVSGEVVTGTVKKVSTNPLNRVAERMFDSFVDSAPALTLGGNTFKLSESFANRAFQKWARMDRGSRSAATATMVGNEIKGLHKMGEIAENMDPHAYLDTVHGRAMRPGIEHQAHDVDIHDLVGPNGLDVKAAEKLVRKLFGDGYQPLKDKKLVDSSVWHDAMRGADGDNFAKLREGLTKWAEENVTDNLEHATIHKVNGRWHIKAVSRAMEYEAKNSLKVVELLYKKPTAAWKYLVLGASPRYFVNNVIGNTLMLMMSADPVSLSKAMYRHIAEVRGVKVADRGAEEALWASAGFKKPLDKREVAKITNPAQRAKAQATLQEVANMRVTRKLQGRTVIEQNVGAEFESFSLSESRKDSAAKGGGTAAGAYGKAKRVATYLPDKNFELTHKFSDVGHRNIIGNHSLNRMPEYQQYLAEARRKGMDGWEARRWAGEKAMGHAQVRQFVRNDMRHVLGQYHTFDTWEKGVKQVVPFYSWTRAISRHTQTLMQTAPYKVAMLTTLGEQGHSITANALGQVPEFLAGAVPVEELRDLPGGKVIAGLLNALSGSAGGRKNILLTAGLNPYASLADIVTTGKGVVGGTPRVGDTVGGQINPVLKGLFETMTGTSMVSGAPIDVQGGLLNVYTGQFGNLPPIKTAEELLQGSPGEEAKLFDASKGTALDSFFGVPTRSMSEKKAAELYRRSKGIKAPNIKGAPQLPELPGF